MGITTYLWRYSARSSGRSSTALSASFKAISTSPFLTTPSRSSRNVELKATRNGSPSYAAFNDCLEQEDPRGCDFISLTAPVLHRITDEEPVVALEEVLDP